MPILGHAAISIGVPFKDAPGLSMLRTRLLPLHAQDNEELVCLQVDADTDNLCLLDMLLDLELFLCLAID